MNKKNNGKIVIAILAMVAVAASVIGFTYAYFTAQLTGNQQDDSVRVTAGKLVATFKGTNSLEASNVVPGWISDNIRWYDSTKTGADGKIYASTLDPVADATAYTALTGNPYLAKEVESVKSYRNMGLTAPLAFTVENTSEDSDPKDEIAYIIKLDITTNGIQDAVDTCASDTKLDTKYKYVLKAIGAEPVKGKDVNGEDFAETDEEYQIRLQAYNASKTTTEGIYDQKLAACQNDYKNATVTLYRGEFKMGGTYNDEFDTTFGDSADEGVLNNVEIAGKFTLGDTGTQQIILTQPETLLKGASAKYFIVFEYANDVNNEQFTKNVNITAEAKIVGVQSLTDDGGVTTWYDEDNNPISFPTVDQAITKTQP